MLAKLELELNVPEGKSLSYFKGAILQSVLMERINQEYAAKLHITGFHPYSQFLSYENGKNIWCVQTVGEEAYHNIIEVLADNSFDKFRIEHDDMEVDIVGKKLESISKSDFFDGHFFNNADRIINIEFITPTAFKSQGRYVFYPDIRMIIQSTMNKYDAASENETTNSEEVLEQLTNDCSIISYNLRSCTYSVGSIRIPAFKGSIAIKVNGPQQMVNFVNMLILFGEYSGIGIKTAMGMGGIRIVDKERKKR